MAQVKILNVTVEDDSVFVTGSVDGVETSIHVWKSHLDTLLNKQARRQYVAGELKASIKSQPVSVDLSGPDIIIP